MTRAPARRPNLELALMLLFAVALDLPQLADVVVPINDTFYNFANFHVFYSEFWFHGDLARWLPYEGFGVQADYEQAIALAPASYLVAILGRIAGVHDALLLFKLGALLEHLAFVTGVYLIARRRFSTRATARVLCVAAAGTVVWYAQQWWDVRIYYLLPLVLHFTLRFLDERRPELLWLAGLTGVAWSIGNLPYLIPLWVLLLLVVVTFVAREPRALFAALGKPTRANALGFAVFALAAAVQLWFLLHMLDHTVVRAADRDPLTGAVEAETFRSYGGNANFVVVLNALLFGWPTHLPWGSWSDNSAYLGLLPLFGFGVGLARERGRVFLALATAALLLGWLSFGGIGTRLAYHLPGLAYFRHVGLVFGLVKVLLLIAAGFGLERIWRAPRPPLRHPLLWLLAAIFTVEVLFALPGVLGMTSRGWVAVWGQHVLVRLFLYGVAGALCWRFSWAALGSALALALAADVALYQLAVYDKIPKLAANARPLLEAVLARAPVYRDERVALPEDASDAEQRIADPLSRKAFTLATRPRIREPYAYVYQFANVDPCRGRYRNDAHLAGVDALLALERQGLRIDGLIGCGSEKLRLVADAREVASETEMRAELAAELRRGARVPAVVLRDPAAPPASPAAVDAERERAPRGAPEEAGSEPGQVEVERFTLNELVARVRMSAPQGGWLFYADAHHPDWRAEVNGADVPVQRANLAFKAVRVPGGESVVRMRFERGPAAPAVAALGAGVALAGVVGLVALLLGRGVGQCTRNTCASG